jgi:small conductance mechanosensitive channel
VGVALTLVQGLVILLVTYVLARFARHVSRRASRAALWDVQLVLLVGRIVYLAVLAIGILTFLDVIAPGLVGPIIGGVGLLGLAFGLAFQDVLKNWISGFFLLLERPFHIGDDITVGSDEGTVETVLLRVTVLRSLDGVKIQIPNQQVYTSATANRSSYPMRKFVSTAHIADGVELKGILAKARGELAKAKGIAADPAPRVGLLPRPDLGPSLEASYWVDYHRVDVGGVKGEVNARLALVAAGETLEDEADLDVARQVEWVSVPDDGEISVRRKPGPAPRPSSVLKAAKVVKEVKEKAAEVVAPLPARKKTDKQE